MEMNKNSGNDFGFEMPFLQEDLQNEEEEGPHPSLKQKQVFSSAMAPQRRDRLAALSLLILAAVLLIGDIGLGVHYNGLAGVQETMVEIHSEMVKLLDGNSAAIQRRIDAKKQLDSELSEQKQTQLDLEYQNRRSTAYEEQIKEIQDEVSAITSQIQLLETDCRHCDLGWSYANGRCYFISLDSSLARRSWTKARTYCQNLGSDLAVIDTIEKAASITTLISRRQDPSLFYHGGFWIGLQDETVEGVWTWLDGTILVDSFWADGEPNNQQNEDCAATYPVSNPLKSWNDAPCKHNQWWICEMDPRITS